MSEQRMCDARHPSLDLVCAMPKHYPGSDHIAKGYRWPDEALPSPAVPPPAEQGEVLPCPFCGNMPTLKPYPSGECIVACVNERCLVIETWSHETDAEAIAAWNTRTPQPPAEQERLPEGCMGIDWCERHNRDHGHPEPPPAEQGEDDEELIERLLNASDATRTYSIGPSARNEAACEMERTRTELLRRLAPRTPQPASEPSDIAANVRQAGASGDTLESVLASIAEEMRSKMVDFTPDEKRILYANLWEMYEGGEPSAVTSNYRQNGTGGEPSTNRDSRSANAEARADALQAAGALIDDCIARWGNEGGSVDYLVRTSRKLDPLHGAIGLAIAAARAEEDK